MQFLAHRGFWTTVEEKNTRIAFERALKSGYGIETDIRDCAGRILISHDMPTGTEMTLKQFFQLYTSLRSELPLALNIKSSGLHTPLYEMIVKYQIKNYFLFDATVPDMIGFIKNRMPFFTRQSEYENPPSLLEKSAGVWMDAFEGEWADPIVIKNHMHMGRRVALVSPELHRRTNHKQVWGTWKPIAKADTGNRLLLCTDFPKEAQEFFSAR